MVQCASNPTRQSKLNRVSVISKKKEGENVLSSKQSSQKHDACQRFVRQNLQNCAPVSILFIVGLSMTAHKPNGSMQHPLRKRTRMPSRIQKPRSSVPSSAAVPVKAHFVYLTRASTKSYWSAEVHIVISKSVYHHAVLHAALCKTTDCRGVRADRTHNLTEQSSLARRELLGLAEVLPFHLVARTG